MSNNPNYSEAAIASFLTGAIAGLRQRLGCPVFANISDDGTVQITAFPLGFTPVHGRGKTLHEALSKLETQLSNAPRIAELKAQLADLQGGAA